MSKERKEIENIQENEGNEEKQNILYKNIENLNRVFTQNNILDLVELLGNKKKLLVRNLISGISKGIGIGIGVTIITAVIVIILQNIIKLNIPIIGEFIADVVDIVQNNTK